MIDIIKFANKINPNSFQNDKFFTFEILIIIVINTISIIMLYTKYGISMNTAIIDVIINNPIINARYHNQPMKYGLNPFSCFILTPLI